MITTSTIRSSSVKTDRRIPALRFALLAILLVCAGLPVRVFALIPDKDLTQYNCQTWTRQTGLPVNGISAIDQTSDGYLWLGTSSGLVRYDGTEFKLIDFSHVAGLRSTIVTSLADTTDNGLWIGLENGGLGRFDGQSLAIQRNGPVGQSNLNVRSIMTDKDGLPYLVTESGVFRLTRSGTYENLLATPSSTNDQPNIICGYQDREGRYWFGTSGRGLYCFQAGKATRFSDPDLNATSVQCLVEDQQGQMWVGTSDGLYCYDSHFQRKNIPPLPDETRALLVDRHGVLWIGTTGQGVARYLNGNYQFFQRIDGLASSYVRALKEDREGSIWVGTRNGISQLTDVKFPILQAAEDPTIKDALAVCASHRGGLWIASAGGATYFNGTAKTYATESGLPNRYIKRVFEASNGDTYVVCHNTILSILSSGKTVASYSNSSLVVGMAEDPQGVVVSVGGDLYRAGTNYFKPYQFKNNDKPAMGWILNLAPGKDGVIWVASVNGIFRVQDGTWQQWSTGQGLTDTRIGWICEDRDGVVWAATMAGIVRLKNNQIRMINRGHGLFDDNIYTVIPDDLGNLWTDASRGIFRVSRQSMNDLADGKINHVECKVFDGMESAKATSKTIQERVACKTSDGRLWFPYPDGVVIVDPAHIQTNQIAPPVHIDRVSANGNEVARTGQLIVPPGRGELEFHFSALSFVAPQKIRFRYRLEGYDPDWVEAGERRLVFYTNLKPGAYTFHVMAANADGIWNEAGDQLAVKLEPRFVQTVWFYLVGSAGVVTILFGAYLWRTQRLRREQLALQKNRDLLEVEVQHRTAELAAANTSLQRESEQHQFTAVELRQRTESLEKEIEERKQIQLEVERVHRQLLDTSRQAGMAEVATNVLHNVGNVLNSVNVSSSLICDKVRHSKVPNLTKSVDLLKSRENDLAEFLGHDPKGKRLPAYLSSLGTHLVQEQQEILTEMQSLTKNISHIKEIVAMQQSYAKASGVLESLKVTELVEDAIRMNNGSMTRHQIKVQREFADVPPILTDKHKVLQILVNLIRNAKHACDDSGREDKQITLRVANGGGSVKISVLDNGVGIPAENLNRIFNHGFTTKKGGHGFGLHSGALAAKEMGGALTVSSEGAGRGAAFILELPAKK